MSHPDRRGDARVRATTLRGLNNLKAVTQCVFQDPQVDEFISISRTWAVSRT